MIRALAKGAMLFAFGNIPGGAHLYREITRSKMGTQATHVDKLKRVWPGYVKIWMGADCGLKLEGLDVWVHEAGWTPYSPLMNFLLTGKGGTVTNSEGRILDRYLSRAVNGALETAEQLKLRTLERIQAVEGLRWEPKIENALKALHADSLVMKSRSSVPLPDSSFDLCHSGGALEHYKPDDLALFFKECFRVLRPGGIASHVLDHRDHLYHADKKIDFLSHLSLSEPMYNLLLGNALTYHNRLLPGQVMTLFEEAGFELIKVRRMVLNPQRYVPDEEVAGCQAGISRSRLAKRFHTMPEIDLHTAAAHYLYRKPK